MGFPYQQSLKLCFNKKLTDDESEQLFQALLHYHKEYNRLQRQVITVQQESDKLRRENEFLLRAIQEDSP